MFEECSNLAELNQERFKLIKSGKEVKEVNKAYMDAKVKLTQSVGDYRRLSIYRPNVMNMDVKAGIPCCGESATPFTIEMTQRGFLI